MRPVAVAWLLACGGGKTDEPKPAPKPEPATPPAPPAVAAPEDMGSCKVTATGAATADYTSRGGVSAATTNYWFADADKGLLFENGKVGLIINCTSASHSLSITSRDVTKETLPFGPKRYTIETATSELAALATFGEASVMGATGIVDITAFDGDHIAGTFALAGKVLPGNGVVKITGTFDYKCPRLSGCGK